MTKQDILDYFEYINIAYNNPNKYNDLSRMLDELVETQPRWIPVEKRNPDKTGVYLTTIKYLNRDDKYCYMIVKRSYYVDVGTWDDSLVIAWMPLPEPYKAESEVKE